jgi:predicted Zn finger-like uncharacterized protein
MIIQCDQCDRKFRVDDSKIKAPGSRVRCSKCGNVFFVEKKESTKPEEKAPPSDHEKLQVDPAGQEQTNKEEQSAKEPPNVGITDQNVAEPESKNKEKVWSIEQDQQSQDTDLEQPSLEHPSIDVNLKDTDTEKTLEPPANEELTPETGAEKPEEDSSISWAALDKKEKDGSMDQEVPDQDLTPPIPSEPSVETNKSEVEQIQQEYSATTDTTSANDTTDPIGAEPSLDLDIDKAIKVDQRQDFQSSQSQEDLLSSNLSVDQQKMSQIQAESYGGDIQEFDSGSDTPVIKSTYKPQRKSFGSKIGSFIGKLIVVLSILVIIASIGLIVAVNLEILSKEQTKQLRSFLVTRLPIDIKNPLEGIDIIETQGQWINSSNGPLFVVQGNITNFSDNIVNYIQLKAEFINNGQIIYDSEIYAGNTFTNRELQTLPLNEITTRLNRQNGDIDFSDPRKLAGKNYNLMPGDTIKFYSVFPSNSQILGLKHNIEVIDAEIIIIEKSG